MRITLPLVPLVLILAGALACPHAPARAHELEEADSLFEKGLFQDALEIYDALYEESDAPGVRNNALLRACQSMTRLYRLGDAVERLYNTAPPEEPSDRARFLILKIEVTALYNEHYGRLMENRAIDEKGKELFSLTPAEVRADMMATYLELWDLRDHLLTMPIEEQAYLLDIEDADLGMYPTLFDFLIHSWTAFLIDAAAGSSSEGGSGVDAALLLTPELEREVDLEDQAALLAASLMEYASRAGGIGREEARERYKVRRLLLPLGHKEIYDLSGLAGDETFYEEDDVSAYRRGAYEVLLLWSKTCRTDEGVAQAAYQAARMLNGNGRLTEAVELCETVERDHPATAAAVEARALRSRILMPSLRIETNTALPPGTGALFLTTRNLPRVYFRLYRVDPYKLRRQHDAAIRRYRYYDGRRSPGWSGLMSPYYWLGKDYGRKIFNSYLTWYRPYAAWEVHTGDTGDYVEVEQTVDPPALETGAYLVLASGDDSFTTGESLLSAGILNITELAMVALRRPNLRSTEAYLRHLESGGDEGVEDTTFCFYAFDAVAGTPLKGVRIDTWIGLGDEPDDWMTRPLASDERGMAELVLPISLGLGPGGRLEVSPLARLGESYAWCNHDPEVWRERRAPVSVFLEVDRPIYRPGDLAQARAVFVRRTEGGYKVLDEGTEVTFHAKDRNWDEFFRETAVLNEFGSASVAFRIPLGRRLGRYMLIARTSVAGSDCKADVHFSVEEYLKPEFEVTLEPAEGPWAYDRDAEVRGEVAYHFGGPVAGAEIKYSIIRRPHVSRYHRFWLGARYRGRGTTVAHGEVESDETGRFTIRFTPRQAPQGYPGHLPDVSEFVVIAEARDAGGRTIETRRSYKAAREPVYLAARPARGFFMEGDTLAFEARRLTTNDTHEAGRSVWRVYALKEAGPGCDDEERPRYFIRRSEPLDVRVECFANGSIVHEGEIVHPEDGPAGLSVPPLPVGLYRLVLTGPGAEGGEITCSRAFIVASETLPALPREVSDIALVEHDTYAVGDTARFLIGSGNGPGALQVEIHGQREFLDHILLDDGNPVKLVEVPVEKEMNGGFVLRWFGFRDMRLYSGEAMVTVPREDKRLDIVMEPAKPEFAPGEECRWHLRLLDSKGAPVKGEVLALMYDRSLEYYAELETRWMDDLYEGSHLPSHIRAYPYYSAFWRRCDDFDIKRGPLREIEKAMFPRLKGRGVPRLKSVSIEQERIRGGRWHQGTYFVDGMQISDPFVGAGTMNVSFCKLVTRGEEIRREEFVETGARVAPVRHKFSDTALFRPHLVTAAADGRVDLSFTAPEQLSSWRIKLFAHTPDARQGKTTAEAVSRKDLMTRVDAPRFFREGDTGTVMAFVHNESDSTLRGHVLINIMDGTSTVNEDFRLTDNRRRFDLGPGEARSWNWTLAVPESLRTCRVRVSAGAGALSDAEERPLPILPARQRLVESAHAMMNGPAPAALSVPVRDDGHAVNEYMVLRVEPALALTLLNTIPFLVEYPHLSTEKVLNQYLPLSIMSAAFSRHPGLGETAGSLPERDTVVLPWDTVSTERQTTLMETPWVWESRGGKSGLHIVDLLDSATVEANRRECLKRLAVIQYPNGAFPWRPGGRPDAYMTFYVLAAFAEASEYGIPVPKKMAQAAINWAGFDINERLVPSRHRLAITALAAYVMTSFSEEMYLPWKTQREDVSRWIAFLEEHIDELTPLSRVHLALAYHNLGEADRARDLLDLAMDGAREDPVGGIYWTPEEYSWIWYRDTLARHALMIRALQEIKPGDERLPGMVKWLLFNRKGNVWKSTKHSAAAVYAILDYLEGKGALTEPETFEIDWGGDAYEASVSPDTWLAEPLTWEVREKEITPAMSEARVVKSGGGMSLAGLTLTYATDRVPEPSEPGMLEVERRYYRRVREGDEFHLKPIEEGARVSVGDEIEVRLMVKTRSQFEYMHLRDPKPAGFEPESRLSSWKSKVISYYEEHRDSVTNFFLSRIPHGEFTLSYRLRPTKPGVYRVGAATLQSVYAPEMAAHSAGFALEVVE